jgi:hypothetical protein
MGHRQNATDTQHRDGLFRAPIATAVDARAGARLVAA